MDPSPPLISRKNRKNISLFLAPISTEALTLPGPIPTGPNLK